MIQPARRIIHLDMDAFYASVEQRDDPALRGRPVAVGGRPESRGVVAAASYEARVFGVRSAMAMARAVRLCPELAIVRPDFAKYRAVSGQVFALFRAVTPLVEPLSLDEAYLDVTENAWGEPFATPVARRLKQQVRDETGLTASAGVAPNKFLAKVSSALEKPDGLTVVPPARIEPFLRKLPVDALWGVGPVTARKLRAHGLAKLTDIRGVDEAALRRLVGRQADWLRRLAHGEDDRPVTPDRVAKSSGSERTWPEDLVDLDRIRGEVERMARRAGDWLAGRTRAARTVTIKVRYADFTTITRSLTARPAARDADTVAARALALLARTEAGTRPVRLLGVSVHNFTAADQAEVDADAAHPLLWDLPAAPAAPPAS